MKKPTSGKRQRTKSKVGTSASSGEGAGVPEKPRPPSPPINPSPADERIAALSETLEHMLMSAEQVGISTPKTLVHKIRDLIDECKKYISEIGKDERLCIAVAGKFSCGKSQFINSLTGHDLAPVDSMRTTCCKTTFTGDPESKHIRVVETATGTEISKAEYKKRAAKRSASENDFTIYLPGPAWKDVELVDTPGFDPPEVETGESGGTTDRQISRDAVSKADVVFFLLDMNSGTLTADSKDYLIEIAKTNSRLFLILNKADTKPPKARQAIMDSVTAICQESGIGYEGAMPYCSLTEKSKELRQMTELGRKNALALATELREQVRDDVAALGRRKEQILSGRRAWVQNALLKRLGKDAAAATKQLLKGIRLLATEAASDDTVDVDALVDEAVDTLKLKATEWLLDNPPSLKSVEVGKPGFLGMFSNAYVVYLSKSAGVRWQDLSNTEEALRQVLGEVHPAFDGCEKRLAYLLVTKTKSVLQSMIPEEDDTDITLNEYCERCDWKSGIPDAKDKIRNKILDDLPGLFTSRCRPEVRMTLRKAWDDHLQARLRDIQRKTQPLEKDIETIHKLLSTQTERT